MDPTTPQRVASPSSSMPTTSPPQRPRPVLLAEVANYGVAIVKRIYGDWTLPNLKSWKEQLLEHAIQPIQQFRYTVGKNATDSALIIDAMDLLYRAKLDGFCLVSSDSDFTRLASRIREEGLMVIGFGERKTPRAFVTACDRFVFTDILRGAAPGGRRSSRRRTPPSSSSTRKLVNLLRWAVEASEDDEGWANLGAVGAKIMSQQPDFDSRSYGYPKLMQLFEATKLFDIDKAPHGEHGQVAVFVANRETARR
jgi:uncharacterized LabA/DUF88 family protein